MFGTCGSIKKGLLLRLFTRFGISKSVQQRALQGQNKEGPQAPTWASALYLKGFVLSKGLLWQHKNQHSAIFLKT